MSDDLEQKEAEKLQYSLRATFFYRRSREFEVLLQEIREIDSDKYSWNVSEDFGISNNSLNYVRKRKIPYCQIFCHPDLISKNPRLIAYYRLIAILPQKGVQRLAFGINALEEGGRKSLNKERAILLAKALNAYICSIIDSDPHFSMESILSAGIMNFGAQVNGSWRNEIGSEGSRRVKEILLTHFVDTDLINQIIIKNGTTLSPTASFPPIDEIQGFNTKNDYKITFGSEPDISILNPAGNLEAAIEVKAGIDPAGALERYGAAKKSFDRALRTNKACTTIYLASCITEGVKKAMSDDRLVKQDFNLTKVFVEDKSRHDFLRHIQWLMHL